jgi:hypothetical protein
MPPDQVPLLNLQQVVFLRALGGGVRGIQGLQLTHATSPIGGANLGLAYGRDVGCL